MTNPNTGKRPLMDHLPHRQAASDAITSKIMAQATQLSDTADITLPATKSAAPAPAAPAPRRRYLNVKIKGIYFEPAVMAKLLALQATGQSVSKFVNRIVKKELGL